MALPARFAPSLLVLVHLYEEIDYEIVAVSTGKAIDDFGELLAELGASVDEGQAG